MVNLTSHSAALDATVITRVFNALFTGDYDTNLRGGRDEPHYLANTAEGHVIYFKEDFQSSALHEAAHWLIACAHRRCQEDYGYWYRPNRDALNQRQFESVEVKPQALEWVLSNAAAVKFRISVDNLALIKHDTEHFRVAVRQQALGLIDRGLPLRAAMFARSLSKASGVGEDYLDAAHYQELPIQ